MGLYWKPLYWVSNVVLTSYCAIRIHVEESQFSTRYCIRYFRFSFIFKISNSLLKCGHAVLAAE